MKKTTHVVLACHKPYGFMKCQLSHPPGILLWGSLERSWKRWVMRTFRRISRLGQAVPTKIASTSTSRQALPTALQAMVNERTQRYSRFSGLQLKSWKWIEVVCFYCGKFLHSKISNQRIICFYKNLGLQFFLSNRQRRIGSHFGKGPYLSSLPWSTGIMGPIYT